MMHGPWLALWSLPALGSIVAISLAGALPSNGAVLGMLLVLLGLFNVVVGLVHHTMERWMVAHPATLAYGETLMVILRAALVVAMVTVTTILYRIASLLFNEWPPLPTWYEGVAMGFVLLLVVLLVLQHVYDRFMADIGQNVEEEGEEEEQ